jgi:hypothetical protein
VFTSGLTPLFSFSLLLFPLHLSGLYSLFKPSGLPVRRYGFNLSLSLSRSFPIAKSRSFELLSVFSRSLLSVVCVDRIRFVYVLEELTIDPLHLETPCLYHFSVLRPFISPH